MAIPGSASTKIDVRAKVRVGEKSERGLPRSTDHFVCDDPEVADGSKELRVVFVHAEAEDVFRTGLEWWRGKLLACYSDEGGSDPTAFRVSQMKVTGSTLNLLDPDDEIRGQPVGQGRTPIKCRFRQCPHFGTNANNKECRVKGRLTFLIPGGRTDSALQFETKGWNTIESLSATLAACRRSGPLNDPARVFLLSVSMESKGTSRYPVVSLKEETNNVEVKTEAQVPLADALVTLRKYVEQGAEETTLKLAIADVVDATNPGWRGNPEFIRAMQARIQEVGVSGAATALLARYEA